MRSLLATLILCSVSFSQAPSTTARSHDPETAIITAGDVRLFWQAYDLWLSTEQATPDKLAGVLQSAYLDKGSAGVKDFIPNRIENADHLAKTVLKNRAYYEGASRTTERMETFIPEIRNNLRTLKKLYPEASFPPVYFVIGAQSSGGTSSDNGLMIGSEMIGEGKQFPLQLSDVGPLVIHELMHFQQKTHDKGLLRAAMREGGADFIAELVTGRHINEFNRQFGDSHEQELWHRFQQDVKSGGKIGNWMYVWEPPNGEPRDLGYYMGYKICQSYYQSTPDKTKAIKTIVEMTSPEEILAKSSYEKKFQ